MAYTVSVANQIDDFELQATTDVKVMNFYGVSEEELGHFLELAKAGIIALAIEREWED